MLENEEFTFSLNMTKHTGVSNSLNSFPLISLSDFPKAKTVSPFEINSFVFLNIACLFSKFKNEGAPKIYVFPALNEAPEYLLLSLKEITLDAFAVKS